MPVVFACISPHGGHMVADAPASPVPQTRAAMGLMREALQASRPDALAVITPHGIYVDSVITIGVDQTARGELDALIVEARTDIDLVSAWAAAASSLQVPIVPVSTGEDCVPFPLDWGVTIPIALLDPDGRLPIAVACPGRSLTRSHLIDFGEALAIAAGGTPSRIALIVSADQGHGHAADGPYGFAPGSAEYDQAMVEAIKADDIDRLLAWDDDWIESGLPDSYWQTLTLIGLRKRVPLRASFLSYEVDHYFGLLCAMYESVD